MNKRVLGWGLALILAFGAVSPQKSAYVVQGAGQAETAMEPSGEGESNLSVKGTNAFGNLLADTLSEEAEEQQDNNGCNIFAVEMDDKTAMVSFETAEDCTLVVGIYDESGVKMLASGSSEVFAGETETFVDIETEDMPQYFYLRGFLVEMDTLRPLADSFESPMHTQEIRMLGLGGHCSGAVTKDGNLYMWGSNDSGQLAGTIGGSNVPIKVLDNVVSVRLGYYHTGAITKDGSLYMWGSGPYGQLGAGTIESSNVPIKVLDNVVSVRLGYYHTGAITKDGSLYMWGSNHSGQLGNGTTQDSHVPVKVLDNVASVSLGTWHSGAVTKDGSLYMWGWNDSGQLGTGTWDDSHVPVKVLDNVASVSLGWDYSGAVTKDGSLYMWGYNHSGQLGTGTTVDSFVPVKVLDNVSLVSLGGAHSGAITEDGSLYMWGDNEYGQLGTGTTVDSSVPVKVLDNVSSVSLGDLHSGAITEDGSLYMWGENCYGQLGNGTSEDSNVPIKINIPLEGSLSTTTAFATEPYLCSQDTLKFAHTFLAESSPATALADTTTQTATFQNLAPNGTYNFYAVKSLTAENILSSDNLLYISQATADSSGELKVSYEQRETYENAVVFVVGATRHNLSDADIEISDLTYTGMEQIVDPKVTHQGNLLVEGRDYELTSGFLATEPGSYTVTISGIGIYTGEVTASYRVVKDQGIVKGDINGDGKLKLDDVQMALRAALNLIKLTEEGKKAADLNGNGTVELGEVQMLLRAALNLIIL